MSKKGRKRGNAQGNKKKIGNLKKNQLFKWVLKKLVFNFPDSATTELTKKRLIQDIIPNLQKHESMSLQSMIQGTGKHHFANMDKNPNPVGKKWLEQHHEFKEIDKSSFFSFAIDNKKRLYGFMTDSEFHVLWYDHYHEIWPSDKQNT